MHAEMCRSAIKAHTDIVHIKVEVFNGYLFLGSTGGITTYHEKVMMRVVGVMEK